MSWRILIIYGFIVLWSGITVADIIVQLNVNRPVNDVSDKFISFIMKPEDLYEALDGSHRKSITRMASMLSHSHLKFVGDYYFASKTDTKLRNPTKIVWKGFNKWTRAMDWSMIIPVPYTPNDWDPMQTLKILNNSQAVGINDCIWQLGTDFGTSAASDYVGELKTFNLMVDSFRDADNNWKIMGADISSGSSPDETRRYVEMSRDLNTAFGWIESSDTFLGNSVTTAVNERDPALKVLFKEKVPVWLTLPKTFNTLMPMMDEELQEGLNWAQTMGDAAHSGFDVIFKHLSLSDWETPKFSFYVTALYKKVMGSRVFSAKPLTGLFGRNNKLYTHCANNASGGLAFMVVNKQEMPLQIAVRSTSKLKDTELWKYALTITNGHIMLNNKRLSLNSTLSPDIKRKQSNAMVQLKTPGLSVTFWVLPNVNMEHCQFTEVETEEMSSTEAESEEISEKTKRYSSTDRLLKDLIKEAAIAPILAGRKKYRQRRSVDSVERSKRFVLNNGAIESSKVLKNIAESMKFPEPMNLPFKRDVFSPERRKAAMEWLGKLFQEPLNTNTPLLRRTARNSDTYLGPFFMTREGKKTAFTKKITEIKKPEKKVNKRTFEDLEFDEEKFFKNVGLQTEPDYVKIPEGDVFLQNIASVNGDEEFEPELQIEQAKESAKVKTNKDIVSEMKPLRLLPTEFYEALPVDPSRSMGNKMNIGSALNSLLFKESFNKAYGKDKENIRGKSYDLKEDPFKANTEESNQSKDSEDETLADGDGEDEFTKAQIKISEKSYGKSAVSDEAKDVDNSKDIDDTLQNSQSSLSADRKSPFRDFMSGNIFGDESKDVVERSTTSADDATLPEAKTKFDELPWWDLTPLRAKRSVDFHYSTDSWHNNMITKDEDPIAAANDISPRRLRAFEYKVDEAVRSTKQSISENDIDSIGKKIVKTFKTQVTKIVDIVSQHVNEWYNSLTKQLESSGVNVTNDV